MNFVSPVKKWGNILNIEPYPPQWQIKVKDTQIAAAPTRTGQTLPFSLI